MIGGKRVRGPYSSKGPATIFIIRKKGEKKKERERPVLLLEGGREGEGGDDLLSFSFDSPVGHRPCLPSELGKKNFSSKQGEERGGRREGFF